MSKRKLNWGQRLMISRGFHIALGNRQKPGWSGSLMFYAFKCSKHGIVENYAQGHKQTLNCPKCMEEKD